MATTDFNPMRQLIRMYENAVDELKVRQQATEMAVKACSPAPPNLTAAEIADRVEEVAGRLFAHMTKGKAALEATT